MTLKRFTDKGDGNMCEAAYGEWVRFDDLDEMRATPEAAKLCQMWFDEWELILPPDARASYRDDLLPGVIAARPFDETRVFLSSEARVGADMEKRWEDGNA